jgi:phosphoglycolate phosphatase
MEPKKKLVIFDFDGVLVDTLLVGYSISVEVNEGLTIDEYKDFFDGNIYSANRRNGNPKNKNPRTWKIYDEKTRELKIPDVLKDAVRALSSEYILAIVTSAHSDSVVRILENEKCNVFRDILGVDNHASKVEKNISLLKKYNIDPKETVFITDTVGDIDEARESGIKSIAVSWGFHERERLLRSNPEVIIDDPSLLVETVEDMLK